MKRDQYIPHEVSMRSTSEVMNLIEKEGMAGYGIYWALMEYLRVQDDYVLKKSQPVAQANMSRQKKYIDGSAKISNMMSTTSSSRQTRPGKT